MSRSTFTLDDHLAEEHKSNHNAQLVMDKEPPNQADETFKHTEPRFLELPQYRPHRPLSPDTLSNLSAEEFDQLGPRNSDIWLNGGHQALKSPRIAAWQAKLRASWLRNAGLVYMLAAQLFGVMMNVTTRLLEIEGNKGKGLHPFQVRTRVVKVDIERKMF